jgi:hypothetical protein
MQEILPDLDTIWVLPGGPFSPSTQSYDIFTGSGQNYFVLALLPSLPLLLPYAFRLRPLSFHVTCPRQQHQSAPHRNTAGVVRHRDKQDRVDTVFKRPQRLLPTQFRLGIHS